MYFGKPFFMTYIGPAFVCPSAPTSRYITDKVQVKNLVAMPNIAVIHIQNIAPGPPIWMATATPAIFPSPMVPESDAVRALKLLTSPSSLSDLYLPLSTSKACGKYLNGVSCDLRRK